MPRQFRQFLQNTKRWVAPSFIGLPFTFAALPALAQVSVKGNIEYYSTLGALPVNDTVNTLDFGTASRNGLISQSSIDIGTGSDAATISFSGTAGVYHGSTSGVAAAPWTASGIDTDNYLAAEPKGAISITYAAPQRYFGLLWGSVDAYNTLTFYQGSSQVGQLGGADISANANGDPGTKGSYFVNANFLSAAGYDRVVLSTSSPAFEFGLVSFSTATQQIAPAPFGLPGATPAGLIALAFGGMRYFRRREAA